MIRLEGVASTQGQFALRDISCDIAGGSYTALVGATGSGKSTLLELVAGLKTPQAGRVMLRGVDATMLDPAARRLGYVPQDSAVFPAMTVSENIAFSLLLKRDRTALPKAAELAERFGLLHLLKRRAVGLSGGEKQRVSLARALVTQPDVLLLDEPLTAVDESTRAILLAELRKLRGHCTVWHVTHQPEELIGLADTILCLHGGVLTARATA